MINTSDRDEQGDSEPSDREVVSVTAQGQATIPKRFREELGIDAPGKVEFQKTGDGTIIVRAPTRLREFRGMLETGEQSATAMLREERKRDKADEDGELEKFRGE